MSKSPTLENRLTAPSRALADLKARLEPDARQKEVLERRRRGDKLKDIAADLGITPPAVRAIYMVAEKKAEELRRTAKCPCCGHEIGVYSLF